MSTKYEVNIFDTSTSQKLNSERVLKLMFNRTSITVEELIESRVIEEVARILENKPVSRALVELIDDEIRSNKIQKAEKKISLQRHLHRAISAFKNNGFFLLLTVCS